jgi:hypothetical protein
MPKKQIRQVHRKERVPARPTLPRRRLFVMKTTTAESAKGQGISLVFIRPDRGSAALGHDPSHEFLNACSRCTGIGSTISAFEKGSLSLLSRPHRAATAKLSLAHPVHKVRSADQQVQVEGPVLAVLESPKTVENQRFVWSGLGTELFVKEQAVTAETLRLVLQCAVGDAELATDLTQTGASDEAMEERLQEVGVAEPVGGGEGL